MRQTYEKTLPEKKKTETSQRCLFFWLFFQAFFSSYSVGGAGVEGDTYNLARNDQPAAITLRISTIFWY
jgi:hypothetical protein